MDKAELVITALQQRIGEIVSNYETQIAFLRAELTEHIEKENRLLRPKNLVEPSPGKGFEIFAANNGMKVGVLNLMGNVFMKKNL